MNKQNQKLNVSSLSVNSTYRFTFSLYQIPVIKKNYLNNL